MTITRKNVAIAKRLRRNPTDAEQRLWSKLRRRQLGVQFRRQHPIGPYIADFVCNEALLVVEVDGGQHNESTADAERDRYLRGLGFRVLRFWNNDVLINTDGVAAEIRAALMTTPTQPPPPAGEEIA